MRFTLSPLKREHARAMIAWRYAAPYEMYGLPVRDDEEVERLLRADPPCLAVLDQDEQFIGFRCFGIEARVLGDDYIENALDMGGALQPDMVGRGLGRYVLATALNYAVDRYRPALFRATVASFNRRARKTCECVGYEFARSFVRPSDGLSFDILLRTAESCEEPFLAGEQTPNKAPEPTTMAVTIRAPSSTARASHGRGSS